MNFADAYRQPDFSFRSDLSKHHCDRHHCSHSHRLYLVCRHHGHYYFQNSCKNILDPGSCIRCCHNRSRNIHSNNDRLHLNNPSSLKSDKNQIELHILSGAKRRVKNNQCRKVILPMLFSRLLR